MQETKIKAPNILNDNLAAFITTKAKKKVFESFKNNPTLPFEVVYVNEYIVLSPKMDHNIDKNIYNYVNECTKDLEGKNLIQVNEYLRSEESKLLSESYIPEIIINITGIINFTSVESYQANLSLRPFVHVYFIDYLNQFIKDIISGTFVPYDPKIFQVSNDNLMDYLAAILAAYLCVNPDQAFKENYSYTDIDLIERIKKSLDTFFYVYLQSSTNLNLYVSAFISEICTTSKQINDHVRPYTYNEN